jgi:hypothetical protein
MHARKAQQRQQKKAIDKNQLQMRRNKIKNKQDSVIQLQNR